MIDDDNDKAVLFRVQPHSMTPQQYADIKMPNILGLGPSLYDKGTFNDVFNEAIVSLIWYCLRNC